MSEEYLAMLVGVIEEALVIVFHRGQRTAVLLLIGVDITRTMIWQNTASELENV